MASPVFLLLAGIGVAVCGGIVGVMLWINFGRAFPAARSARLSAAPGSREERSAQTLELLSDWLWETDRDQRFVWLSDKVISSIGVRPEWHYGKTRVELMGSENIDDHMQAHLDLLDRHEPFTGFVYRRTGPDGDKWIETSGIPFFDEHGAFLGYHGIGRDITEMVETREQAARAEDLLLSILDALPVSITMIDRAGRYTYVNQAEADRYGYDRDEVIGKSAYDVLPPDVATAARSEDKRVMETGAALPFFEETYVREGRKYQSLIGKIPIRQSAEGKAGGIDGVCMIALDITERAQAMAALRESGLAYRRALELFPEAVIVHVDNRIVFANTAAQTLFRGDAAEDLLGRDALDLVHPDDIDAIKALRARMIESQELFVPRVVRRYVRRDGTDFTGEGNAATTTWDRQPAVLVVVRDITEQLARNAELEAARKSADEANRAKSEFLASMSHEIRTPLNGVLGMASLMLDDAVTETQREQIRTIQDSGKLLLSLLGDILDISKIEAGHLELEEVSFDLATVLQTVSDLWAPRAVAQGIDYLLSPDGITEPVLVSDPTRLRQILFNYLSNALKFTSEGEVRLNVSQSVRDDGLIETRFEVSDTGPGIPPDKIDGLFGKFVQADSSVTRIYGGTGLGLAISRELATAMGGAVGVDSIVGEGSTFWFTLVCPRGQASQEGAAAPAGVPPAAGPNRSFRVLVAEDNEVNQLIVQEMLARAGHDVRVVDNGEKAVSAIQAQTYDAVLMDVQMPTMDGFTATRKIRALDSGNRDIPIIALTANSMKGDSEMCLAAGMDDYLVKPVKSELLLKTLQRHCSQARKDRTG